LSYNLTSEVGNSNRNYFFRFQFRSFADPGWVGRQYPDPG